MEVDCVGLKKITVVASIDKHKAYISKDLCGVNDTQRHLLAKIGTCCKTKTLVFKDSNIDTEPITSHCITNKI